MNRSRRVYFLSAYVMKLFRGLLLRPQFTAVLLPGIQKFQMIRSPCGFSDKLHSCSLDFSLILVVNRRQKTIA